VLHGLAVQFFSFWLYRVKVNTSAILMVMRVILHSRALYILGAAILIGAALVMTYRVVTTDTKERITGTVTRGTVAEIVSVSGVVESRTTTKLAFPVQDIVSRVDVAVGDRVETGDVLAELTRGSLEAEHKEANAALTIAEAEREELLAGPRDEARRVTDSEVAAKEADLARTIKEQNEKVENARRALFSDNLEALPVRTSNDDTPPTITGTYTCDEDGTYYLDVYPSSANSGYSYRLSGLESGTFTAYTESPAPLGECGLRIQFAEDEAYGSSNWTIDVPNTRGASYTQNLNAYTLAQTARENAIEAAEEALQIALEERELTNASPREEALARANAAVTQAKARLQKIESRIADRTLRAPFSGTVTAVEIQPGESVAQGDIITLVGDGVFELTARIPEIDIAKLETGDPADVVFDARDSVVVPASVRFISPVATEIDGVGYFETRLTFTEPPAWLRAGLNADVNIYTEQRESVTRVPVRFISEDGEGTFLSVLSGDTVRREPVVVEFRGNNGYAEIRGVEVGTTIVAQ